MKKITLKKGEERRIRRGHLWVYSNEIADNLAEFEPGESVSVVDSQGKPLGSGTVNPHSLIAVRLHSRMADEEADREFFERRIGTAWNLRQRLGLGDVCRVVHGEGDGLPGLVVDRFGDVFIIQHTSAGMDARKEQILEALDALFSPSCVVAADENPIRELEGLPLQRSMAGELEEEVVWVELDGLQIPVDLASGQKTGGYLDQVFSQRYVATFAEDASVLDAFSYTGGFGLHAAAMGAKRVVLADRSERALELATEAFKLNGFKAPETVKTELLDIKIKPFAGDKFDIVVCDPPPLVRNKKRIAEGLKKYEQLFAEALSWTNPEGFAALFSCSHQVGIEEFTETLRRTERRSDHKLLLLAHLEAGPDHPVAVAHPETEYLHGAFLQVL